MKGYIKIEFTPTDDGRTEATRDINLKDIVLPGKAGLLYYFLKATEISIPEAVVYLQIIEDYKKGGGIHQ